jgi:hypothetical protein
MLASPAEWSDTITTATITNATIVAAAVHHPIFYYLFFSSIFPLFGFI